MLNLFLALPLQAIAESENEKIANSKDSLGGEEEEAEQIDVEFSEQNTSANKNEINEVYADDIVPGNSESKTETMFGLFEGVNSYPIFGQVKVEFVNNSVYLDIENFEVTQESKLDSFDAMKKDLHVFIARNGNMDNAVDIGSFEINHVKQKPLPDIGDFDVFDKVIIYDVKNDKIFAESKIKTPLFFGTSPELFVDWVFLHLISSVWSFVLILAFPITFDYIRNLVKFVLLSFYSPKNKKDVTYPIFKPKISILIPAHNEEFGIRGSIESALSNVYPNKEIIVIDDGSTDKTYDIAKEYYDKGLIKMISRDQASGSKAAALNFGSVYATGDLIISMDGDTRFDKESIGKVVGYFNDENVSAVSGNVKIQSGDYDKTNLLTKLQEYEYFLAIELGRKFTSILNTNLIISGAFGIFRRNIFDGVGKFDKDTLVEDFDLTLKIKKMKGRVIFVDESIAWTYCPNNLEDWYKQRKRWSFGQYQVLRKHKDILRNSKIFGKMFSLAVFDMWLMDFLLNILFVVYVAVISVALVMGWLNYFNFVNTIIFVTLVYLIFESAIFLLAYIKSQSKVQLRLVFLAPIMALVYRPLLRLVTFSAHINAILGKKIKWH